MVIAWGEFGRTPKVNAQAGRDHYPNVFSAALAGGGIKGGRAIGESDSKGAFPKEPSEKVKIAECEGAERRLRQPEARGRRRRTDHSPSRMAA